MRVTGGELRGRRLASPARGRGDVRPTTDRVREALFSILGDVSGAEVLDLYCGTGSLGIEALSRGAARAALVDSDVRLAQRNVAALGLGGRVNVVRSDALRFLERARSRFDLVLCDPPYRLADRLGPDLDKRLRPLLAPGARVIVEAEPRTPLELGLPRLDRRAYGSTAITIYAAPEED